MRNYSDSTPFYGWMRKIRRIQRLRHSGDVSPAQRNVSLDQPKTIRSYGMEVLL